MPERVELLLAAMTLEEKVGQLGSRWVGNNLAGEPGVEGSDLQVAPMQDVFTASGTVPLAEASRHGLGHLTRVYGSEPVTVTEGADELVHQQRIVMECSRFDIPALVHEECLTGFTAYGATVYPAAIAWGATWDPDLVRRMAAAIGRDMAALGVHQGLSPVLDVVRDYRWGRVEETIGEDPYLVSMLGTAYVQGLQSAGVIATLKHFAGYSASRAARNHGPVSMGPRELRDVILPSFETAVALGGVGSVMNSYSDVDGVPAGANSWLLTEVLRDEWGFEGTVVSDYWAVPFLATMHRVATGYAEAGALALEAGIDVELPDTLGYGDGLVELVRSGALDEALVDRAARRALLAKAQLGLLDAGWTPEASVANAAEVDLDSPANRELAREVAERSVVLLDAGTALPIRSEQRPLPQKVAVVGPTCRRPPDLHGLLRVPDPRAAPPPAGRPGHRGPHGPRRAAGRAGRGGGGPRDRVRRAWARTAAGSRLRSRPRATPTSAWPSSATSPACSATAPRERAATPRTSGCRECRPTWSRSCWPPGRRSCWSSSRAALRPGTVRRSPRRAGAVVLPRRGGRVRDRRGALGSAVPRREAAGAGPASCRWAAQHLPPAAARRHRERRHHHGRLQPALSLRVRRLLHLLRAGRGARQCRGDRHGRGGGGERGGDEHRRARG